MPSTETRRQAPRRLVATSFCCGWAERVRQKRSGKRMRRAFMDGKYIPCGVAAYLVPVTYTFRETAAVKRF
jgi:hypothetical protein